MVLLGLQEYQTAASRLVESLTDFCWNWSAWLDWIACCLSMPDSEAWEQEVQTKWGQSEQAYMVHFALIHLQSERQGHSQAAELYEGWMPLWGPSTYLYTQYALSQYHLRNFGVAQRVLHDLHQQRPYRLEGMDVYSNILYVQEDSVNLCQLAHRATQVDKYRSETCCIVGNYYSLKQQRAKAIDYFKRALQIDRSCVSAWTLLGHEYVEWKQTAHAMEAYRRAVQVAPNDYRAWYGLGQTYEFLNLHLHALYYYKKASQLRPYDARMWCALGMTLTHLKRTEDAILAYERAWQYDDPEGVATQKLAALYRQDNQEEKAALCYMRHLELRYQTTQSSPSMSKNNTMNDDNVPLDVLLQGLVVEGAEAEALLYLSNYHKSHGDYDTAGLFASRLLEYPGPEKEQAKALLHDIRMRKSAVVMMQSFARPSSKESTFEFSP
jgi:anaphase-promoting complex subunit 8